MMLTLAYILAAILVVGAVVVAILTVRGAFTNQGGFVAKLMSTTPVPHQNEGFSIKGGEGAPQAADGVEAPQPLYTEPTVPASSPDCEAKTSIWCLVANVTREPHPEGLGGKMQLGTKHFAPGAKLYCFPKEWGDGGEKLRVLGRHRGGGSKLIEIIVSTKWLVDWRVQRVFHPYVVHMMREWKAWDSSEESRQKVAGAAQFYNTRCRTV
jgi:hypothetical protein